MHGNLSRRRGGEIKSEMPNHQNNFTTIYIALPYKQIYNLNYKLFNVQNITISVPARTNCHFSDFHKTYWIFNILFKIHLNTS